MQEATQRQTTPPYLPEILPGLTAEQVNLWRHHPVSRVWLQWVNDYADALEKRVTAEWLSGKPLESMSEARGRILACREMAASGVEAIRQFYGVSQ